MCNSVSRKPSTYRRGLLYVRLYISSVKIQSGNKIMATLCIGASGIGTKVASSIAGTRLRASFSWAWLAHITTVNNVYSTKHSLQPLNSNIACMVHMHCCLRE